MELPMELPRRGLEGVLGPELPPSIRLCAGQVTTYSYDGRGNLRNVALPDGRVVSYVLDGWGRRVAKKVNGSIVKAWLYRGNLAPVAELDSSGAVVLRMADGFVTRSGATHRVVTDSLGSPRLIMNSSTGAVVQRMEHDEWGQTTNDTSVGWQPIGFAGGIYDPDTGLVRFGARDLDPATGRWTTRDPVGFAGASPNLYVYTGSDPVNYLDKDGLRFVSSDPTMNYCLTVLMGNPALATYMQKLDASPATINLNQGPGEGGPGGAWADGDGTVSIQNGTPSEYNVDMDIPQMEGMMNACGFPEGANPCSALAHELGHVYANLFEGSGKERWGLAWEQQFNGWPNPRPHACQNRCRPPQAEE
jgi:RHS repeat-associated protein